MVPSFNDGLPVETLEPRPRESLYRRPQPRVARETPGYIRATRGVTHTQALGIIADTRPLTRSPRGAVFPWPCSVPAGEQTQPIVRATPAPQPRHPPEPPPALTAAVAACRHVNTEPTRAEIQGWHEAQRIVDAVCRVWPTTRAALDSPRRSRDLAAPRQCAMAFIREFAPQISTPLVGALFGGRDHTTVMHAERMHSRRMKINAPVYAERAQAVRHFLDTGAVIPPPPVRKVVTHKPTDIDVAAVFQAREDGMIFAGIAEKFGISQARAYRLVARERERRAGA